MRNIRFDTITKRYNDDLVINKLSLNIPGGTFFALLGPSGSGKTTLLRLIAGLEEPDSGSIFLGDQNITHMPIYKRRVNTVFQNYALFPHMDVFDNVAYGLSMKNIPTDIITEKVIKILTTVHLDKHIYKSIHTLSGGQKQRVALARAIINEPDVLLLDEPLAALDLKLREKMLIELIDLQSTLKTTFVYVTHDQFEALTVADHMAIMNHEGEIEQVGTPKNIYEFPSSTFVAAFVGITNLLQGILHIIGEQYHIEFANLGMFEVVAAEEKKEWIRHGNTIFMSLRPEKIEISKTCMVGFSNFLTGIVQSIVYHGRSTQYNVRLKNNEIVQVFEQNEEHFPQEIIDYDDSVFLYWQKENVVLLEK
ncbi:MAG TPA: ABC transporter ATP-binding protein [Candidatus Babeliales bacterium]|nr:ABC transporter ATP-binding protein [Candidatus Babeliales bacterium]